MQFLRFSGRKNSPNLKIPGYAPDDNTYFNVLIKKISFKTKAQKGAKLVFQNKL